MAHADPVTAAPIEAPEISIVVPAFNEADNLRELAKRVAEVLGALGATWEVVIADDGSRDCTWQTITELHDQDCRFRGVRLSRNFGHQYALLAGLLHARGRAVISMDADLQHPPSLIPVLVDYWKKGSKIVHTKRRDPEHVPFLKRLTSRWFYRLFSSLSGIALTDGMADFRLLDRQVVNELARFPEEGLFLRGITQWIGFPSSVVSFDCGERFAGKTKYNFRRMLKFAWHGVSSFSLVPLRIAIGIGVACTVLSFVAILYAILGKFLDGHSVPGWASVIALTSFFFGLLFFFLALLAEYIGRILVEVRGRPRFIVSDEI